MEGNEERRARETTATKTARLLRKAKELEQAGANEAAETLRRAADQTASQESQKEKD